MALVFRKSEPLSGKSGPPFSNMPALLSLFPEGSADGPSRKRAAVLEERLYWKL
jgi:hypothetical protein